MILFPEAVAKTENKINQLDQEIKSLLSENKSALKTSRNKKVELVAKKFQKEIPLSFEDLQVLQEDILERYKAGEPVDQFDLQMLQYIEQEEGKEVTNDIKRVQNDFSTRGAIGFLSSKYGEDILAKRLQQMFPNNPKVAVQKSNEDGTLSFSLDGKNFFPINPKEGDIFGDIAQTTGVLAEPGIAIASTLAGGPLAGIGSTVGLQGVKETVESKIAAPERQQQALERLGDIATVGAVDVAGGAIIGGALKAGSSLTGVLGRTLQKAGIDFKDLRKRAGKITEEKLFREIEKRFGGTKPIEFGRKIQQNILDNLTKIESEAKRYYDAADRLALEEAKRGAGTAVNLTEYIDSVNKQLAQFPELKGAFDNALNRMDLIYKDMGEQLPLKEVIEETPAISKNLSLDQALGLASTAPKVTFTQATFDPTKASSFDLQKLTESISQSIDDLPDRSINTSALITAREKLKELRNSVAGRTIGELYKQGDSFYKKMNDLMPEEVRRKTLGRSIGYGRELLVDPGKFFKNLTNMKGGLSDQEVDYVIKASGLDTNPILQKEGADAVVANALQSQVKPTGGGTRLKNLPSEDILNQMDEALSGSGITSLQKGPIQKAVDLNKQAQQFVSPANELGMPSQTYQADNVLSLLTRGVQQAEGFGDLASPERAAKLFTESTFAQSKEPLQQLLRAQEPLSGRVATEAGEDISGLSRNALPALTSGMPGAQLVNALIRGGAGTVGAGFTAADKAIPGSLIRPTLSGILELLNTAKQSPRIQLGVSFTEGRDRR